MPRARKRSRHGDLFEPSPPPPTSTAPADDRPRKKLKPQPKGKDGPGPVKKKEAEKKGVEKKGKERKEGKGEDEEEEGEEDEEEVPGGGARNSDGDTYWEISDTRRVTISTYMGRRWVNIREFYDKDGEMMPGKKGISLTVEQFNAMVSFLPHIETVLISKGERGLTRPSYGPKEGYGNEETKKPGAKDGEKAGDGDEVRVNAVEKKKNYEETSDEEWSGPVETVEF